MLECVLYLGQVVDETDPGHEASAKDRGDDPRGEQDLQQPLTWSQRGGHELLDEAVAVVS